MRIGILGVGKEGKSGEAFLRHRYRDAEIQTFADFDEHTISSLGLSDFDLVLRSPSVPPRWLEGAGVKTWTSVTRLFFELCPCQIIGVTGTKGKGTTSSLITALLTQLGFDAHLVGNIGNPALDELEKLTKDSIVVYEMSSFQLWDLEKSPHIAAILGLEPDHLNVHNGYDDYVDAKAHITTYQTATDSCIYYAPNPDSTKIAMLSAASKIAYPLANPTKSFSYLLDHLAIPGRHNQDNAEAALLVVSALLKMPIEDFVNQHQSEILTVFENFKGLPHRLEFLREINGIRIYDDNFSTNVASTKVALEAFPERPLVAIIGGRDKTDNKDLPELVHVLKNTANLRHVILMGESGHALTKLLAPDRYTLAETLGDAVTAAMNSAEGIVRNGESPVLLMSPAAASFDMFNNVYDRGDQFKAIVDNLAE